MQAVIFDNRDFIYEAKVQTLSAPPGAFSFSIASRWRSARDPAAEQV